MNQQITSYLDYSPVSIMIGYDPRIGGGPWQLNAGREPNSKWEMVFDRILADRHGLKRGDQVEVMGGDFTLVGFFKRPHILDDKFLLYPQGGMHNRQNGLPQNASGCSLRGREDLLK